LLPTVLTHVTLTVFFAVVKASFFHPVESTARTANPIAESTKMLASDGRIC
jgi:hypothetical protein